MLSVTFVIVEDMLELAASAPRVSTMFITKSSCWKSVSTTKYACPSCEKLKTQDLCFITKECDNIINPLQFGKKRKL